MLKLMPIYSKSWGRMALVALLFILGACGRGQG